MAELDKKQPAVDVEKSADYEWKLEEINRNITALTNEYPTDDMYAKENLNVLLNKEFLAGFVNSLTEEQKNQLKWEVKKLLDSHKTDENFQVEYKGLIALAQALGVDMNNAENTGDNAENTEETSGNEIKLPNLGLEWELSEIEALPQEEKTKWAFFSNLVENKPDNVSEDQENNNLNLWKTKEILDWQGSTINEILEKNPALSNNEDLVKLKNLIENIWRVIKDPVVPKVQMLQDYIYSNLDEADKENFKRNNHWREWRGFDGQFWVSTLAWLNKLLEKTKKYIDGVKETLKQKEISDKLDKVKAKDNVTIKKGWEIKAEDLVEGVSEWVNVALTEWQDIKTDTVGDIVVKIDVKLWDEVKKTLDVKVKVEEEKQQEWDEQQQNQEWEQNQKPTNTEPIKIGDWETQQQYQVMENSSDIASKSGLNWATFYSTQSYNSPVEWDWSEVQPQLAQSTNQVGWDREYYVRLSSNPDDIYKVKVDQNGNLCPIATEISSKLNYKDGSDVEVKVLFTNNESCLRYLFNKVPDAVKWDIESIRWDAESQDYMLKSFGRELSIEPMTIAWDWKVSSDLSKCLAFINLTNYIRSEWESRGKKDPDVNKKLRIKWIKENWKKVYIDKERFWLTEATSEEIKNYKKYNNGEKWEDDWDKKKENKIYKKI